MSTGMWRQWAQGKVAAVVAVIATCADPAVAEQQGWLGLHIAPPGPAGIVITGAHPASPFHRRVEVGDRIRQLNARTMTDAEQFIAATKQLRPGSAVTLVVERPGERSRTIKGEALVRPVRVKIVPTCDPDSVLRPHWITLLPPTPTFDPVAAEEDVLKREKCVADQYIEDLRKVLARSSAEPSTFVANAVIYLKEQGYHEVDWAGNPPADERPLPPITNAPNQSSALIVYERALASGRYPEAVVSARQILTAVEARHDTNSREVMHARNRLARALLENSETSESRQLWDVTFRFFNETAMARRDPLGLADSFANWARLEILTGNGSPEWHAKRVKELLEPTVAQHADRIVESLILSGSSARAEGRTGWSEMVYAQARWIVGKNLAPDHPLTVWLDYETALMHLATGFVRKAMPLAEAARRGWLRRFGTDSPLLALADRAIARAHLAEGSVREALAAANAAWSLHARTYGQSHPQSAESLALLREIEGYNNSDGNAGRDEECPQYLSDAWQMSAAWRDKDLRSVAARFAYRAERLLEASDVAGAAAILECALRVAHRNSAKLLESRISNLLARARLAEGKTEEAGKLTDDALMWASALESPRESSLARWTKGHIALLRGDAASAVRALERAVADQILSSGTIGWRSAVIQMNLARAHAAAGANVKAQENYKAAMAILSRDIMGQVSADGETVLSLADRSPFSVRSALEHAIMQLHTAGSTASGVASGSLPTEYETAFELAQLVLDSRADVAIRQMALRSDAFARGGATLADLMRRRQDILANRARLGRERTVDVAPVVAGSLTIAQQLGRLDLSIKALDGQLKRDFPNFSAGLGLAPLSIKDAQASLGVDEILLTFLDTNSQAPEQAATFLFAVTRHSARMVKIDGFGTRALMQEVAALRCGLDAEAWTASACLDLTGKVHTEADRKAGKPLPFDAARANALYNLLFGEVADLIKGKHLLLVPSGPLTQLPFQVLVTEPPSGSDYNTVRWLARDQALTVLPAVSSLKALRQNAKSAAAKEPFIGFGNPVLTGNPNCGVIVIPDKCPDEEITVAVTQSKLTRSASPMGTIASFYRNGLADVAKVRELCPLPDTAHELGCVARSLGAPLSSMVLGKDMTETTLKNAPLDRYRVLHFATHGLLAGETATLAKSLSEPALVMSPPHTATVEDDGLLTASEIAGLKLNADWIVMSACNTAGGGGQGAEALSGLARAFFYAGARALLVSHWPVNSYAATMLTSRTFAEMRKDASIGRSEAFRRAMVALMDDKDRPWAAHPSVWAPFVVVGEGAAAAK